MDNLENFLDGEEPPVEAAEAAQEPQATEQPQEQEAASSGPERDESGRFKPKGDKEDAPPASDEKSKGLEAGIAAERKKRQDAEQRYADLERQIAELREASKPKEPANQEPPPSIWDDEGAWQQHFGGQVVSTAVQQATMNAKLDMSEMMARQAHDDFDDMKGAFLKMAESNPALAQQALGDPHPWNRAYQIAKNAKTMEELGATDLDTLKAQLLEQLKAEQAQSQEAAKPNLPQSLAGEQSARGSSAAPNNGPPSLQDILGG